MKADGDAGPALGSNFRIEIVDSDGHTIEVGCSQVIFPTLVATEDAALPPADQHLVLRRATTGDKVLHDWWAKARRGRAPKRRSVRVTLLAADHERPIKRWHFYKAQPAALHYSPLDAMAGALVMESLAVRFDSVEID